MAGDRTRIDCLEGNHADHYTTIAVSFWKFNSLYTLMYFNIKWLYKIRNMDINVWHW